MLAAFGAASGAPRVAWSHRTWIDVLGPVRSDTVTRALLEFAVDAGERGTTADDEAELAETTGGLVAHAARAAVALAGAGAVADRAVDDLQLRARGQLPRSVPAMASDAVTVVAGAPFLARSLVRSAAGWLVARSAPALPEVRVQAPSDASLLAHLVAEALPGYLSGALVRILVVRMPVSAAVGVQSGPRTITVRMGNGVVEVADGIAPDALLVLECDLDGLIETIGDTLVLELSREPEREGPDR